MFHISHTKKSGYTLVEMVIYIAILSAVCVAVLNTTIAFTRSYRDLLALRLVDSAGIGVMERITREVRSSTSVDTVNSTFGSNPGVLTLVATSGGVSTTTKFYLQSNTAKVDVNGVYFGPLSLSSVSVGSLTFSNLTSSVSGAVKIDLTVSATVGEVTKTKSYHSTVVLKGV